MPKPYLKNINSGTIKLIADRKREFLTFPKVFVQN